MRVMTHSKSSKNLRVQIKETITLDVNHQQDLQVKQATTKFKTDKESYLFLFLIEMLHEKRRSET